jgi:hypothetical protein
VIEMHLIEVGSHEFFSQSFIEWVREWESEIEPRPGRATREEGTESSEPRWVADDISAYHKGQNMCREPSFFNRHTWLQQLTLTSELPSLALNSKAREWVAGNARSRARISLAIRAP